MKFRWAAVVSAVAVGALALSACSPSGAAESESESGETTEKVKVAISTPLEAFAQLLVGIELGTYADEGIEIEVVNAKPSDAIVLLATGEVDAVFSAPSAAFFNAVDGGSPIKIVAPGMFPPEKTESGLWVSKDLAPDGKLDPELLKGEVIASVVGPGAPVSMVIEDELQELGVDAGEITFQTMGATDILVALESGAVKAGWLSDPVWLEATASENLVFAFGQPADITVGAVLFGPTLLEENPELGQRFLKGFLATTSEYLQGAYHDDPVVSEALVNQLGVSEEQLSRLPELTFSTELEFPDGLLQRFQETFADQPEVLVYSEPIPDDELFAKGLLE